MLRPPWARRCLDACYVFCDGFGDSEREQAGGADFVCGGGDGAAAERGEAGGARGDAGPDGGGVLLVCLGQASRVSEYLMGLPKTYRATVRLGVSTTTYDAEGEVMREGDCRASRERTSRRRWRSSSARSCRRRQRTAR